MSVTAITNIIDPEVLADQVGAKFPDMLVFGNTNVVQVDGTFPMGSPGTKLKIPSWKRIAAFSALSEGSALTPGNITTTSEYAVVQRAGTAVEILDTAELVSAADPVGEVAGQLARRAAEYIDGKLVTACNNTPNTLDYTGSGSNSGKIEPNAIVQAMMKLGDNYGVLVNGGRIIMHSKVYSDLMQLSAIQNQYQFGAATLKDGAVGQIFGLPIHVSDLVTTNTVSSTLQYNTYIVGPGALGLFYQRAVMVEFDRDTLKFSDIISANVHFAPHLFGYDENGSAVVAEQNKSIHAVTLTTK